MHFGRFDNAVEDENELSMIDSNLDGVGGHFAEEECTFHLAEEEVD